MYKTEHECILKQKVLIMIIVFFLSFSYLLISTTFPNDKIHFFFSFAISATDEMPLGKN